MHPLGIPVDPEVYGNTAQSSGPTRSGGTSDAVAKNSRQETAPRHGWAGRPTNSGTGTSGSSGKSAWDVTATTSTPGNRSWTATTRSAKSWPANTTLAPLSRSKYSSSSSNNIGLMGTTMALARKMP